MNMKIKILISIALSILIVILGIGIGSVFVSPVDILAMFSHKLFNTSLPEHIPATSQAIILNVRLPRAFIAFVVGSALAVSGTVMQSVLKNPLASSYTLGVSSGASLGAALVIVSGLSLPFLGRLTLPTIGLLFGLLTVYLSISFAAKMDRNMENNTIILVGMVFSLFINAILTLVIAYYKNGVARLTYWQMGSFSMQEWSNFYILFPIVILCGILLMRYTKELDILTFGETDALTLGVDLHKTKWTLLGLSAALTGCAISFVGVIGFIDLIAPHVVRKIFGSSHRIVVPMSMLFGGSFMVLCDLVARTVASPLELPVGAITALVGAPFFAYIYFSKRNMK